MYTPGPLDIDDYDFEVFEDWLTEDYEATLASWLVWGWEPYDSERDDGGKTYTLLRRPKWLAQFEERVRANERENWTRWIEEEHLWDAERDGKTELAEVLTEIVNKLRASTG